MAIRAVVLVVRSVLAAALGTAALALLATGPASAAIPVWTTYDHDAQRTATDPDSGSPVAPSLAWSAPAQLDGAVYAQPLVVADRVYVATENDTVYALNAATGAIVWQHSVGTPVPSGDLPCGNISPTVGISSTPAIDVSAGRIYVAADVLSSGTVQHQLTALDLSTGAAVSGFPVAVDPPGADPKALLQRGALALDGGRVIVPYGGNDGDCGTYHGWLVSAPATGTGPQTTFEVEAASGQHGGAIWGAGDGPSVDSAGHVFVSTGNGFSSASSPDLQESVVELDATLNVLASWTASNWKALDQSDTDLGSSEPLPLPNGLLFVAGKDGVGRLLSGTALASAGQVFSATACASGGVFGASLYRAGVIYVPCSGGLVALALSSSGTSFTPAAGFSAPSGASGPPVFAGGLVWSTGWRGSNLLYGLDPATGAVRYQTNLGSFAHFATPSAGGGRLFAAANDQLTALTISQFPPATSTALAAAPNPVAAGRPVTLTATVAPAPDGGTVSFTSGGAGISGCTAVPVTAGNGLATCRTALRHGMHTLQAVYGGDAYFGPSTSAPLSERVVVLVRPRLTGVRVRPRRFTARHGTTIRFTVSQAGRLQIGIRLRRAGHRVHHRCVPGAQRRARCTALTLRRRLSVAVRRGRHRLRLRLPGLAPGRYVISLTAVDAAGLHSRTVSVLVTIIRPGR